MARWWDSRVLGFVLIFAFLVFWELSSRTGFVDSPNWSPVTAIPTAAGNVADGWLLEHTLSTLRRMLMGYSLAVVAGVSSASRSATSVHLEPASSSCARSPGRHTSPVLSLFLGIGDVMKVMLLLLASTLSSSSGILSVDPVQVQTAKTFGLGSGATLREVVLPAASPQILTGMRISLSIALIWRSSPRWSRPPTASAS